MCRFNLYGCFIPSFVLTHYVIDHQANWRLFCSFLIGRLASHFLVWVSFHPFPPFPPLPNKVTHWNKLVWCLLVKNHRLNRFNRRLRSSSEREGGGSTFSFPSSPTCADRGAPWSRWLWYLERTKKGFLWIPFKPNTHRNRPLARESTHSLWLRWNNVHRGVF